MSELGRIVGENVRKLRLKRGLTQEVLAQLVGYSHAVGISRVEAGSEGVPLYRLELIAQVLRVPVTKLFSGVQDMQSNDSEYLRDLDQLSEKNRELITRIVSELATLEQQERAKSGDNNEKP